MKLELVNSRDGWTVCAMLMEILLSGRENQGTALELQRQTVPDRPSPCTLWFLLLATYMANR